MCCGFFDSHRLVGENRNDDNNVVTDRRLDCECAQGKVLRRFGRLRVQPHRAFGFGLSERESIETADICTQLSQAPNAGTHSSRDNVLPLVMGVAAQSVNVLYSMLLSVNTGGHDAVLFDVLQNLYFVIEELSLPTPRDFASKFAALGVECLPRAVFLQYLDRFVPDTDDTVLFGSVCCSEGD